MISYLLLSLVSLAMIFSVSPDRLVAQTAFLVIGLGLYLYLSRQDHAVYSVLASYCYPLALLFLASTYVLGEPVRGASRWIELAGFQFQPSEIAKPLLILAFSQFLTRFPPLNLRAIIANLLYFLPPFLLVFFQPDLGTSLVLTAIFAFQLLIAGLPWLYTGLAGLLLCLALFWSPHYLAPYQLERLSTFTDPASDPLGTGYNVIQSIIAVGSGGVVGKGLGHGTQSHLRFLPERHTDFMFASLSEELGFVGAALVLSLLTWIIYRLLAQILSTKGGPRLVLAGTAGYLFFQTFVNLGMNLGLAPVTGVTLPLISYGGSSVLGVCIALGLADSVSHDRSHLPPALEIV